MFCWLNVNVAQFLQCFCQAGWVWGRGPVGGTGGYQVVTGDTLADTLSRTCKLLPTFHQYCVFCAAIPSAAQKPFAAREEEKELLFLHQLNCVMSGTYNWLLVITNYKENWKHIWLIFASEKKRNHLQKNLFSNKTFPIATHYKEITIIWWQLLYLCSQLPVDQPHNWDSQAFSSEAPLTRQVLMKNSAE